MGSGAIHFALVDQALAAGAGGQKVLMQNPNYLELRSEVAKIGAPAEVPDWERIFVLSQSVAGVSADLLVYAYLALSTFVLRGYAPLSEVVPAWTVLIDRGWDFCSPRKQRVEVFKIWSRRIAAAVRARPPRPDEAEAVRNCVRSVHELASIVDGALDARRSLFGAIEIMWGLHHHLDSEHPLFVATHFNFDLGRWVDELLNPNQSLLDILCRSIIDLNALLKETRHTFGC